MSAEVALIFEVLAADLAARSLIERDKQDEVAARLQATMRASQARVVDTMAGLPIQLGLSEDEEVQVNNALVLLIERFNYEYETVKGYNRVNPGRDYNDDEGYYSRLLFMLGEIRSRLEKASAKHYQKKNGGNK